MRVSVLPEDFPDEKIKWKVVSGSGSFTDSTGRDATFVASGSENSDAVVQVDFGDCPGNAPQLKLRATTMHEVKIYPCVISRVGRPPPISPSQIEALLPEVNAIYRQVGLHFSLGAPPTNVVNDVWARDGLLKNNPDNTYWDIVSYLHDKDGLEVYFIEGRENGKLDVAGLWTRRGIIVKAAGANLVALANTLAHEIGHACGWNDIYDKREVGDDWVFDNGLDRRVEKGSMPGDWNNGTGSSFYNPFIRHYAVLRRLLMYGLVVDNNTDIPAGYVDGLNADGASGYVIVGRGNVELNQIKSE